MNNGNQEGIVRSAYLTDRFVWGIALGALVGWAISAGVDHWRISHSIDPRFGLRLTPETVASACLLLPRPLLLKTVFRLRRSVFMRDEDVHAMLMGRLFGVLGGVWLGATVNCLLF
ncbi:hypothetical protein [Paraburkholderia sp. UCT2]|uniref:hypothetical protein n=1 Tax=Paraburkholderia sp. UCT2 TaxID=2615208 RepID=UPI0016567F73|nr:hypothetical protein [Paraburkholderia sp. UCT2]MBC8730937.1 hypothetical protein [Paraburkholderia sp. UCT2]